MEWIDHFKEKPKIQDYYLVTRMDRDSGDTWYEVERFEPQDEYVRKYSKEFKQEVNVLVKSTEPQFRDSDSFVIYWMEIPKKKR